jgi:beta-xylosidase
MRQRVFVVIGLALLAAGMALPAAAASVTLSTAPAHPGDFPDPTVLYTGGQYVAYSTGSGGKNLQVMTSPDLQHWGPVTDPLPTLPGWAAIGFTWAPGVEPVGGGFVMYYTARDVASGRQCVGAATSGSPTGPFTDSSSAPLVCQTVNGGSIDPSPFLDSTGTRYLVWKSDDNSIGKLTNLWSQKLSASGLAVVGSPTRLLTANRTYRFGSSWQQSVIEGPAMWESAGRYVLFYGGGPWNTSGSGIGYATCSSPAGPCTDQSQAAPWLASRAVAVGPQGPSPFVDATGRSRLAYAAWTGGVGYQNGGVRSLWIDALEFKSGRPILG